MAERPIEEAIAHLGITIDIPDDELIAGAVVLIKTVDEENKVALFQRCAPGMSWLERYGMLQAAADIEIDDTLKQNS